MSKTNPEVTYIVKNRQRLLRQYDQRLNMLRDYVRGVVKGYATGLYLYGRPGCGKTHTVRTVLEQEQEIYSYQRGHLSPKGVFGILDEHADEIIVLDDMGMIFRSEVALQLLLSGLEPAPEGINTRNHLRRVRWKREKFDQTVLFSGGLICISNIELHDGPILDAFRSRVNVFNPSPTNHELGALMLQIADHGWPSKQPSIRPEQCNEICRFVIAEMSRVELPFDLRLLVHKAFPLYQQVIDGEAESDWRDLVRASIEQQIAMPKSDRTGRTRVERKKNDIAIVREIIDKHSTREDRLRAWCEQTGKSQSAFYRTMAEIR